VGSHSRSEAVVDEGSQTRSYFFGPSTETVSRIRVMIDNDYFEEVMGREPGEETIPEPQPDEAMVFEEFVTAGLRMPPHPMLSDILLNFRCSYTNLLPMPWSNCRNTFGRLRALGASLLLTASPRDMSCTTSRGSWKLMGLKYRDSTGALIFIPNM
jgi:hypothetical protein